MKLSVLIFTYRPQSDCIMSVHANMCHLREQGHEVTFGTYGSALIHRSRNQALNFVKRGTDEAIIFIDDDILLADPDSLVTLVEDLKDNPVVSGLCTSRGTPKDPEAVDMANSIWSGTAWHRLDYLPPNRLVKPKEGDYFAAGAACLAIRRDAAETVIDYFLSASDWMEDERERMSRLHVRNEYREAERQRIAQRRQRLYDDSGTVRVFGFPILDNEEELSEDIGFCNRCRQNEIPIAIDTRITPGHVGDYPYGIWNYVPRLEREAVRKAG